MGGEGDSLGDSGLRYQELLIQAINKLLEIFKTTGAGSGADIKLPKIVVVGDQSSGKSGVLESLVSQPFLPRGTDMITRCPIVINMIQEDNRNTENDQDFWRYEFDNVDENDGFSSSDPDDVRQELERRTGKLIDGERCISSESIILRVMSNRVVPSTLVDLPGNVKNPSVGQPEDIEMQIIDLIEKQIGDTNSIILAVVPANVDIATAESLKVARKFDKSFERTLIVITKLDLMDKGTNASELLKGRSIPGNPRIIGVKNRSQLDLTNNKSISDAHIDEIAFFKKNYPFLGDKCGSNYLAKQLNVLLMTHIEEYLPTLRERIASKTKEFKAKNQELGSVPTTLGEKQWNLEDTIKGFVDKFEKPIVFNTEISAINRTYPNAILNSNFDRDGLRKSISKTLNDSVSFENFTDIEKTFKELAYKEIKLRKEIWMNAAKTYQRVLNELINSCCEDRQWVELNRIICKISREIINEQFDITENSINGEIEEFTNMIFSVDKPINCDATRTDENEDGEGRAEEALELIFPSVPFQDSRSSSFGLFSPRRRYAILPTISNGSLSNNKVFGEKLECKAFSISTYKNTPMSVEYVQNLIETYCCIKKEQIADKIPPNLLRHMFKGSVKKLTPALRKGTDGQAEKLIVEIEELAFERWEVNEMLEINLAKAKKVIDEL